MTKQSLPRPEHLKSLLKKCDERESISKIHAFLITTGRISTNSSFVIASYARIGDIVSARNVFDKTPHRGIHTWNSMIVAYSKMDNSQKCLELYNEMIIDGFARPDSSTFTAAIKACSSFKELELGEKIWKKAVEFGYKDDIFVVSSVLNLYVSCGKVEKAMRVFDGMGKKDVVCYSTMMKGFVQCGEGLKAVNLYRLMQREGVECDRFVMFGLIQSCAFFGDLKLGQSVHGYMIRREIGVDRDVVIQTSLVDMYAKHGHLDVAAHIFMDIQHKNAISWGALISGFAQNGLAGKVLELLVEMQNHGFKPDLVSLVGALMACSQVGHLKMGKSVHGYIVRNREFELISGTALVVMYIKCGLLSIARSLFDQIESKDLILWNAMIDGYGIHGHGKESLSFFLKMRETNLVPDHATFTSLLSAFSHSGLVEQGRYWFGVMINDFKIQPTQKHYACVVDLLSRAGQVEEAYKLIKSMKTEPGVAVWVALLSGCHNHRKFMIGEMAAKKIIEACPDDLGIFSLVSNFFSMAKRWDEVALLRKIMKKSGTRKIPGYSALEANGKHIAFLTEDKSHQYEGILQILDSLDRQMRITEFSVNNNEEEMKESIFMTLL